MDLGSCFDIFRGWLECLFIPSALLLGLQYGFQIYFTRSKVTSTKSTDFKLHSIVIDKPQSLNTLTIW